MMYPNQDMDMDSDSTTRTINIYLPHIPYQTNEVHPTRARAPRMRVNTNYVQHTIQLPQSILDSDTYGDEMDEEDEEIYEEEEEEEENYNEFVDDQDMSEYLETRTYYYDPVMDIDVNEGDQVCDEEEQEVCAICLLEYQDEDTIGKLQCGHEFHAECIKKWLLRKKACPFCRAQVWPRHENLHYS
ncbi:hypothetical protein RND71_004702 [Anisodus tanguticus]|uniref:RING-type E3 ubiquitin transferase n=1 Tax=Anisodus tanguticus TaxID=243964 RepID=A0AAE1SQ14_9SOLA|nr:hypothetical protein RND71_004702 [Anisodus tanguticus]